MKVETHMEFLTNYIENDLYAGVPLADCLRRIAVCLDAWIADQHRARDMFEARIARLEATVTTDKEILDEVDGSLRQTWDNIDKRVRQLEARLTHSSEGGDCRVR